MDACGARRWTCFLAVNGFLCCTKRRRLSSSILWVYCLKTQFLTDNLIPKAGAMRVTIGMANKALMVMVASCGTMSFAGIRTGKSRFWQTLETGLPQTLVIMGTSMSSPSISYWPFGLVEEVRSIAGMTDSIVCRNFSEAGISTVGAIARKLPIAARIRPDAVIMEYSITDAREDYGISIGRHKDNIRLMVDTLRTYNPEVDIFLYETGLPRDEGFRNERPNLERYYESLEDVAAEKQTYLVKTFDRFRHRFDSLNLRGTPEDYSVWVKDSHHPSLRSALEIIVPVMMQTMSGADTLPAIHDSLYLGALHGATYYTEGLLPIRWYSPNNIVTISDVSLSLDSGTRFHHIAGGLCGESGYDWPIPARINGDSIETQNAVVRIATPGNEVVRESECIPLLPASSRPALGLVSLVGWSFRVGDTVLIEWSYDPTRVSSVNLLATMDGGRTYESILGSTTTATCYRWVIPERIGATPILGDSIRIVAEDYTQCYHSTTGPFFVCPRLTASPNRATSGHATRPARRVTASLRGAFIGVSRDEYPCRLLSLNGRRIRTNKINRPAFPPIILAPAPIIIAHPNVARFR